MEVGLIVFFIVLIGCIIRYASGSKSKTETETAAAAVAKLLAERTIEELREMLQKAEMEVEMQKIKYQGALSNPHVWSATRDLIKQNLEGDIKWKLKLEAEIKNRSENNY